MMLLNLLRFFFCITLIFKLDDDVNFLLIDNAVYFAGILCDARFTSNKKPLDCEN